MRGIQRKTACDHLSIGHLVGKSGKPSIAITKSFDLYMGNLTDANMWVTPGEMFGFGTGSFKEKIVSC